MLHTDAEIMAGLSKGIEAGTWTVFDPSSPDLAIEAVTAHDWATAREIVRSAASDGRATFLPAGARDNKTAQVLIDGKVIGQASTLMHRVKHDLKKYTMFGESPLLPN